MWWRVQQRGCRGRGGGAAEGGEVGCEGCGGGRGGVRVRSALEAARVVQSERYRCSLTGKLEGGDGYPRWEGALANIKFREPCFGLPRSRWGGSGQGSRWTSHSPTRVAKQWL